MGCGIIWLSTIAYKPGLETHDVDQAITSTTFEIVSHSQRCALCRCVKFQTHGDYSDLGRRFHVESVLSEIWRGAFSKGFLGGQYDFDETDRHFRG